MKNATEVEVNDSDAGEQELALRIESAKRASSKNEQRSKDITSTAIMINIGIVILISMILSILLVATPSVILSQSAAPPTFVWSLLIGFSFGSIIWLMLLLKTKLSQYFFINVKQNWIVVLGNQLKYDNIPSDPNERVKMFERGALREVGQGLCGKWPWEVLVESVNLKSEILIGPVADGNMLVCITADDSQLSISYQVVITPLVGFAINLVRRNQTALEAYFKGIFDQKIILWVKTRKEKEVFDQLATLREAFNKTLGGSNVSLIEMDWGVFTNDPQIISVNRNERYQRAAEGTMIGKKMATVVKQIKKSFADSHGNQPDSDMVLAVAAANVGSEIPGLVLIPGAGKAFAQTAGMMGAKISNSSKNQKQSEKEKK